MHARNFDFAQNELGLYLGNHREFGFIIQDLLQALGAINKNVKQSKRKKLEFYFVCKKNNFAQDELCLYLGNHKEFRFTFQDFLKAMGMRGKKINKLKGKN